MNVEKMNEMLNDLAQLKDELVLKASLAQTEASEELEKLEPVYNELKNKLEKIGDVAGDSASEIKAAIELGIDAETSDDIDIALELAGDNLKNSYNKIKNILS